MKFEIVTLFPEYFELSLRQSLLGRAWDKKLFDIEIINLRDFATDRHRTVDDAPFGGGGGMVLKLEPLDRCLGALGCPRAGEADPERHQTVLTSAAGRLFDQKTAIRYSLGDRVTVICGHYLGVDERLMDMYEIDEVSVGDYILTGGEPAAAVIVDAVARLIPGVIGNFESALRDSHMDGTLGAPVYTRPAEYDKRRVPEALLSGDPKKVEAWERIEALHKCARNRPDLLKRMDLTDQERQALRGPAEEELEDIERNER